ncbi:MFS transporter [Nanoarchaeota archaeon]
MSFTQDQKLVLINQALFSIHAALTASFIIPFALVLGASNTIVGVLHAVQFFAIMLAQIPGEKVVEKLGRRVVYLSTTPLARLLWFLIVLIPVYFNNSLVLLVFGFFLINFFEYLSHPAFMSMIADTVPSKVRGWFFSRKMVVKTFFNTIIFWLAGYYLDLFPKASTYGFINIMLLGVVIGVMSSVVLSGLSVKNRLHLPTHKIKDYFKIKGNLRKFIIYVFCFNFAYSIAGPFFTVYMLENLGMSYSVFVTFSIISVVIRLLAHPHLGKICDLYGDKPVAVVTVFGTALVPLLFFFITPSTLWILPIAFIASGFFWAGADLTTINMLLDFTNRRDRAFQVSAYTFYTALPIVIAPIIGGWIADSSGLVILGIALTGIPLVFIISTILRASTPLLLFTVPEVRVKQKYPLTTVFMKVIEIHPERGIINMVRYVAHKVNGRKK